MILWRISSHADLEGRGGLLASARWHSQGRAVVYLAETPAGALVEALVHLELRLGRWPATYGLLKVEAADGLNVRSLKSGELQPGWSSDMIATRTLGDLWLDARSSALLRVPSAIVPETWNVLLNPEHPDARQVEIVWHERYPWDARLLR